MRTDRDAGMRASRCWRAVIALGILVGAVASTTPAAAAAAAATSTLAVKIDGGSAGALNEHRTIRVRTQRAPVELEVTNRGSAPLTARTVRFSGRVMGLTFFAYETSVEIHVGPGATETRRFTLDLASLKGQATGLIPASVSVLDSNRKELASRDLVVDVRGSARSVYGTFALLSVVLTAIALALALRDLAGHRLPANRWGRGLRFLVPGIGIGLVLVIGCSMLRIAAPHLTTWGPIVLICGGALFVLGYLSPTPEDDDNLDPAVPPTSAVARRA